MTAPRRIVFQKNVLVVIDDEVLVVVCNDDLNRALLLLWDWFRLDTRLRLAVNEVLDEFGNIIMGDLLLLVKGELLVLDGLLDGESGPFVGHEVEISSMRTERFSIDSSKVDSTLMLCGKRLEGLGKFFALFWSLCEDIGKRKSSLVIESMMVHGTSCKEKRRITHSHISSICIRSDLAHERNGGDFHEVLDGFGLEFLIESVLALVEVLIKNN